MTDSAPDDAWYMGRLAPMLKFGWAEADLIAFLLQDQHRIQHRLEWLENTLEQAERFQERLERLTAVFDVADEHVTDVQRCLSDPMIVSDARGIMDRWSASKTPWEPALEAAKPAWEAADEGETWLRLFHALCAMDESSHGAVALIQPLFGQPERTEDLWNHVNQIMQDERRQRTVLNATAEGLRDLGHDVPDLGQATLMEALACVEGWQTLHHAVEDAVVDARRLIGPFDKDEAERRVAELRSVRRPEDAPILTELRDDLMKTGRRLEDRRKDLSESINIWRREGFVFPLTGDLQPEELYEWETNFESISETVDRHRTLRAEFERFDRLWPTKTLDLDDVVGHLDRTEELEHRLDALRQEWKRLELDGLALLEPYRLVGMQMDEWMNRLMDEPLSTLERMLHERTTWDEQKHLIERYDALDVSAGGHHEQQVRLEILRRPSLAPDIVGELETYVELKERRQQRHRMMLEDALGRLRITHGELPERTTESMSLAAFEAHVASLERGEGRTTVVPFADRAVVGLRNEVAQLRNSGWNTTAWEQLLDEDPRTVAVELNLARPHLRNAPRLMSRLEALPWHRDVDLALDVQQQARQPEALAHISQRIPEWLAHLSQRPEGDAMFVLNLWTPQPPAAQPLRPATSTDNSTDDSRDDALPDRIDHPSDVVAVTEKIVTNEPSGVAHEATNVATEQGTEGAVPEASVQVTDETSASVTTKQQLDALQTTTVEPTSRHEEMGGQEDLHAASAVEAFTEKRTKAAVDVDHASELVHQPNAAQEANPRTATEPPSLAVGAGEGTVAALSALEGLLSMVGLGRAGVAIGSRGMEALPEVRRSIAQHVNLEPRDVRVARLLRLMLRLLPTGDGHDERRSELLNELKGALPALQRWTRRRLEARHSGATGDFLDDALTLGQALHRIPGLGRPVPLEADRWPLPTHVVELDLEVKRWARSAQPPAAGGVRG